MQLNSHSSEMSSHAHILGLIMVSQCTFKFLVNQSLVPLEQIIDNAKPKGVSSLMDVEVVKMLPMLCSNTPHNQGDASPFTLVHLLILWNQHQISCDSLTGSPLWQIIHKSGLKIYMLQLMLKLREKAPFFQVIPNLASFSNYYMSTMKVQDHPISFIHWLTLN